MIRRLILLRHAKSSWHSGAAGDHQRPLNPRGRRSAPLVAHRLVQLGWIPQAVLASDSQRTRETWEEMSRVLPPVEQVEFLRALYLAPAETLREYLRQVDDAVQTLLLVGHNPGCQVLVTQLSGVELPMKTADAALLATSGPDWFAAASPGRSWRLEHHLQARQLDGDGPLPPSIPPDWGNEAHP